jgi:hypothetical protein
MTEKQVQDNFDYKHAETMKDPWFAIDIETVKLEQGDRFKELLTIINRYDPIGLIEIGAPEDEYESEVATIIVQMDREMTEQQVHDLIYQEFLRWFSDKSSVGPKDAFKELSEETHKWIKKFKGMTELEFLEDLKTSCKERLKEISDILSNMQDTATKEALSDNHKKGMEDLNKINARIREIKNK